MRSVDFLSVFIAASACVATVEPAGSLDASLATMAECIGESEGHSQASQLALPRAAEQRQAEAARRAAEGLPALLINVPGPRDFVAETDRSLNLLPFTSTFDLERFNARRMESRDQTRAIFEPIFQDANATDVHLAEQAALLAKINAENDRQIYSLPSPLGEARYRDCVAALQVISPFVNPEQ